ncbi:urease accessory protein UreH domain-containing protein [Geofilum sp. OHC36d9]|uniref:urease accessory protein UreH domain-containing protein n=1 Tax=Geofilum sp. OHC36d9 TaxID=3458413 RepID=UPI00403499B9
MMTSEFQILLYTAASLGFVHTVLGPDHYLPFIMIGRARNWPLRNTLGLTFMCGVAHVVSSVVIGLVGITIGAQLEKLTWIETFRGNLAAWALIAFGLVYAVWGLQHWRKQRNIHRPDGLTREKTVTPWVLFIIFVLGPCEVLIPVLMYPAANESMSTLLTVAGVFGVTTLATMLAAVFILSYGLSLVAVKPLEKFSHTIAGLVIFLSGIAIQLLGV